MKTHASSIGSRRTQRGAAALVVTLLLFFAMLIAAVFANRNLLLEQRSAANQYRAAQAFEAAEAGLEWAVAQLNANRRIGADCQPATDPTADSFRSRYLQIAAHTGVLTPTTASAAGSAIALRPSCVRSGNGWSCSCPANGPANLTQPTGAAPATAFVLQFLATDKPGVLRVTSTGCTQLAGACVTGSTTRADASATVEVALGLVGGLRTPPGATLTARGSVDSSGALGVHNADPSTALAIDAGGAITAPLARLVGPAGTPVSTLLASHDAALAALPAARFFAAHFGVDQAAWAAQPAVTRLGCTADCSAALLAAISSAADGALIQVDGDLNLSGPLTLGSAQKPVAIVVSGSAQLDGDITLHGLLYANALAWNHATRSTFVRGALLSETSFQGDAVADLIFDSAVLDRLRNTTGSFARVGGSWRDF
jgi:Tfp pilus assembly protein PilX